MTGVESGVGRYGCLLSILSEYALRSKRGYKSELGGAFVLFSLFLLDRCFEIHILFAKFICIHLDPTAK